MNRNYKLTGMTDTPRGEIFITKAFATRDEAIAKGYDTWFSSIPSGSVYSGDDDSRFALIVRAGVAIELRIAGIALPQVYSEETAI